jgi:hypothetical protein
VGEEQNQTFQLLFNASLKVDFRGSRVTSGGGLILVRELDEQLGLEKLIEEHLSESRQGMNKQFKLADLLRQSVYSLSSLLVCFSICGCGTPPPPWSQIHGDIGNTSFNRVGPRTLDITKARQFRVGDPVMTSPVETPSGTILVAVQTAPANPANQLESSWSLLEINPSLQPPVLKPPVTQVHSFGLQLSTPAVDSEGNIYLVSSLLYSYPPLRIFKVHSNQGPQAGAILWFSSLYSSIPTVPRPLNTPTPKLIEVDGKVSLFVAVFQTPEFQVLAVDATNANQLPNQNLRTVTSCIPSVTNSGYAASAAPPAPPAPPYPEDPTMALALDKNGTPYLIDANNQCGITFFLLASATTVPANWPPNFAFSKVNTN